MHPYSAPHAAFVGALRVLGCWLCDTYPRCSLVVLEQLPHTCSAAQKRQAAAIVPSQAVEKAQRSKGG